MSWSDAYIDIPFKPDGRDRNGLDCWGMIYLIYRERLGIDLPDYSGIFTEQTPASLKRVARIMAKERDKWLKVEVPDVYDVVMLRTGIYTWHVGLVIGPRYMLHIMSGINSVVEEFTGMQWKNRVEEFRRYAG